MKIGEFFNSAPWVNSLGEIGFKAGKVKTSFGCGEEKEKVDSVLENLIKK